MSKDKACISAVKEVCQRCHLYKENCGMLDFPDQCSISGRYIDGYRQAEKDLELTWEDIKEICDITFEEACRLQRNMKSSHIYKEQHYQEVLKRFKEKKER